MLTKLDVIERCRKTYRKTSDHELRALPFRDAYIYGRVSDPSQIVQSKESIREIARLVKLAIEDGYQTGLDPAQVEGWLDSVSQGASGKGVLTDSHVTVDIQDLGLSGQLSAADRKGLAALQEGVSSDRVGGVYVTEGVSRLSRDRDRILPFQLLKLLKEHQVRVRTPEGVWSPAIERDWEYLADEFEQAIGELKVMNKRLLRRRVQKAGRGEFVGEPIPPGFIVPVVGRRPNGQYEYGKYEVYQPHAEIDKLLLQEYVRAGGSLIRTMHAVRGMVIPFFPPELSYMERLSSLRACRRLDDGYQIAQSMIIGLATNPKLVGVWRWGDCEPITDNHPAAVPQELFLEAFEIAKRPGKPKGRASTSQPLEWHGLLQCCNHADSRRMVSRAAQPAYSCELDYRYGSGAVCLRVNAHDLEDTLSQSVLGQLELGPVIEDIISRLEEDTDCKSLGQTRDRHEISRLERQVVTYKALLPCCVDEATGKVDRDKEAHYWEQIRAAEQRLNNLKTKPPTAEPAKPEYAGVRDFLRNLPVKWREYSRSSRNRFLKSLIEKVELRGTKDLVCTVYWKAGSVQNVLVHRGTFRALAESVWTEAELNALRRLYPNSPTGVVMAALPGRSWKSITLKTSRIGLKRTPPRLRSAKTNATTGHPSAAEEQVRESQCTPHGHRHVSWEPLPLNLPQQSSSRRETGEGEESPAGRPEWLVWQIFRSRSLRLACFASNGLAMTKRCVGGKGTDLDKNQIGPVDQSASYRARPGSATPLPRHSQSVPRGPACRGRPFRRRRNRCARSQVSPGASGDSAARPLAYGLPWCE